MCVKNLSYSFASHIAATVALRWMPMPATVSDVSEPLAEPLGTITLTS